MTTTPRHGARPRTPARRVRRAAVAVVAVLGLLWSGVAAAYWTDSGTVTSGTVDAGVVGPVGLRSCTGSGGLSLVFGNDLEVTWTAPAGVPVTGYRATVALVSDTAGPMQTSDWRMQDSLYVRGPNRTTDPPVVWNLPTTQTTVRWGILVGSLIRTFTGTIQIQAVGPGGWTSTVRTVDWTIAYLGLGVGSVSCTTRASG